MGHKMTECQTCQKPIRAYGRKTTYCHDCLPRCPKCSVYLKADGTHNCKSVDARPTRHCEVCDTALSNTGRERYSKICQPCCKKRWRERERQERAEMREQLGGKCSICGYNKCSNALHFHHLDSSEKYDWNVKGKGGSNVREIKTHPERFQLLCSNCHIEIHSEQKDYP